MQPKTKTLIKRAAKEKYKNVVRKDWMAQDTGLVPFNSRSKVCIQFRGIITGSCGHWIYLRSIIRNLDNCPLRTRVRSQSSLTINHGKETKGELHATEETERPRL